VTAHRDRPFGASGPTLADVGESGLLRGIVARSGSEPAADGGAGTVLLGPGDDAALWQPPAGSAVVLTQDALVEQVDFRRAWTTPHRLGRRAVAVALSDIAAMGARPSFCLVTLCAPATTPVADVERLHAGVLEMCRESGCVLIGGDVSAIAGPLVLDVVAGGVVAPGAALRRDAGRPGDALVVTGVVGRAAAGLRLLLNPGGALGGVPEPVAESWRLAQLDPVPRLREGVRLSAAGLRCAGDVSDGLLVDAARTAEACGCGAELWQEALPVDAELRGVFGDDWPSLALGGGEDFELLAAVPPGRLDDLLAPWPADAAPLTVVGRLVEERGLRLLDHEGGAELPAPPVASRHFGS
jgi:thiamine-monophosphate kinase